MFNLEQAVGDYCKNIAAGKAGQADLQDELQDHLFCEIEVLQSDGLSAEQAFNVAIRKLGEPQELLGEYRKNRRIFRLLCDTNESNLNEYTQHRSDVMSYKQNAARILGQAILWGAAIILSGLLLGDADQQPFYMLLLVVLASTSIAMGPGLRETARVECRYIKILLGFGKRT